MTYDFANQLRTLAALQDYYAEHGYSPTFNELADIRGISEKTTRRHIRQLVLDGHVRMGTPRAWRQIRLVGRAA